MRAVLQWEVTALVGMVFDVLDMAFDDGPVDEQRIRDFLANRLVEVVQAIFGHFLTNHADSVVRVVAKQVAENLVVTLMQEVEAVRRTAASECRPVAEVVVGRAPTIFMRVSQGVLLGLVGRYAPAVAHRA
ncbi:MAG: hypothetical protein IPF99_34915 [Deltaproteobacteria bacterium]|nr:hypothetical protein [Deltaproteobacteria bacterium]